MNTINFPSFYFWDSTDYFGKDKLPNAFLKRYKKNVRGDMRYYFRVEDNKGDLIYRSAGFMTRGGRNKAVNRYRQQDKTHNIIDGD